MAAASSHVDLFSTGPVGLLAAEEKGSENAAVDAAVGAAAEREFEKGEKADDGRKGELRRT